MAVSQRELALQMLAQLRLLDPSVSAEVGTPERLLIDVQAQGLYDSQIDLAALSSALDIDSKQGAQLDRFLSIFGFRRQKTTFATGFVTFGRLTPSTVDIRIPANQPVQAPGGSNPDGGNADVQFYTVFDVTLPAGETSVVAPIRASTGGVAGNVAANTITEIVGQTLYGVTSVINELAVTGGRNAESDDEFKVRFKNTVFRNLAGTQDQYMALAIATAFTSKANVVGPQSHYREYIQVPPVADNIDYDIDGDGDLEEGLGNFDGTDYTTALSTIPYAKYIYENEFPVFVSNGAVGVGSLFFRPDADFTFNHPPLDKGDTHRMYLAGLDDLASSVDRPNITFNNVYGGMNTEIEAVRPGDIVLLEFSYLSNASRNDFENHISNAVDVFIDGGNDTLASTIVTRPSTVTAFSAFSTSKYYYENYRRSGEPTKRPIVGNVLMQLFWQPVSDVPSQILVGTVTYFKGIHYWPVIDVSPLAGTVRARGGIEWSTTVPGMAFGDSGDDPSAWTGRVVTDATGDPSGGQPIEVEDYTYDKNIVDLQAALDGAKQVTTDVLAHKGRERYFKLDVTVMYSPGHSIPAVNTEANLALDQYLQSLFFGNTIQLSDLLQVLHNVPGIDNVRWTTDTPNSPDLVRVYETDRNGVPLLNVTTDRIRPGTGAQTEVQGIYLTGEPTGGQFALRYGAFTTAALDFDATESEIATAINGLSGFGPGTVTVDEDFRSITGVVYPIRSFRVSWVSVGAHALLSGLNGTTALAGGPFLIKNDFFLRDDELARLPVAAYTPPSGVADSVPGLIMRPRAQNTWTRSQ